MKFIPVDEPNEVITLRRWISTEGKWEFGLRQMIFGVRVSLSKTDDCTYTLDYCAGSDQVFALLLLATIAQILERYPEDIHPDQLQRDFPGFTIKPIDRDPYCWKRLQEMAAESVELEQTFSC